MTLMVPFMGKRRNVTIDNFFTSFLLAKELKKKKTSLVKTMNKVRCELPASAKCLRQRSFSKLMKAGDMAALTVYQGRPKKNVWVLSFLHMSLELGESEIKTPENKETISRNPILTYLLFSGFSALRFDRTHSLSGIFSPDHTHASRGVIIFLRQNLSFSELSTSSLSSLDPYSDYVGVNISLLTTPLCCHFLMCMPPYSLPSDEWQI